MKVAVLVSGGVDSSVALELLKRNTSYELTAFYLKIWLEDDFQFLGQCPWEEDLQYARAVCERLEVPLEVVSLQTAYWDRVVSQAVEELRQGRTPSPDVLCNQRVKFGAFLELVDRSFDKVATGHYAQILHDQGYDWLVQGNDPIKDQSYFLSQLSQQQLSRCLFPIGHLPKSEVRKLAAASDLATASRKDSQGICFLGKIKYSDFVKQHLGEKPGPIIERESGRKLGEHQGFWFHTIGQRKGLGLSGGPWFVVGKDCDQNIVYVSTRKEHPQGARLEFTVRALNWIAASPFESGLSELKVKIRHGRRMTPCKVEALSQGQVAVHLEEPDGGVAAGQYAVFYWQDRCLGSGIIA